MPSSTAKTQPSKPPRRLASHGKKQGAAAKQVTPQHFVSEYAKYFRAPATTPQGFQIYDLTDGASVSTTSHT